MLRKYRIMKVSRRTCCHFSGILRLSASSELSFVSQVPKSLEQPLPAFQPGFPPAVPRAGTRCFCGAPAPLSSSCPAKAPRLRSVPLGVTDRGSGEPWGPGRALRDTPWPRPPAGHRATAHKAPARPAGQFLLPRTARAAAPGLCRAGLGLSPGSVAKGSQGSGHRRGYEATSPGLLRACSSLSLCCWVPGVALCDTGACQSPQ